MCVYMLCMHVCCECVCVCMCYVCVCVFVYVWCMCVCVLCVYLPVYVFSLRGSPCFSAKIVRNH